MKLSSVKLKDRELLSLWLRFIQLRKGEAFRMELSRGEVVKFQKFSYAKQKL